MLKAKRLSLSIGAAIALYAAPASAATTFVDFTFNNGAIPVASGNFSFDSALSGQLNYTDLNSFNFAPSGSVTYDLDFINSGGFSSYYYFGFNATSNTFVTANIAAYPQILSAIKADFSSGFFVRDDTISVLRNYAPPDTGDVLFNNISINVRSVDSAVPEPATWAMMIFGFGLIGGAIRYRRRQQPKVRFAF